MGAVLGFVLIIVLASIAGGVAVVAVVVWGITKLVRSVSKRLGGTTSEVPRMPEPKAQKRSRQQDERRAQRPSKYVYLDVDAGTMPADIVAVMGDYQADEVVGVYARDIIDALDTAEFRRRSLLTEIDNKFQRGSISWDRFAGTVTSAIDAIIRNCALLANHVQSFDSTDYARIARYYQDGGMHDAARLQRWRVLQEAKEEMDGLHAANERLLLELGKLSSELGKLSSSESNEDNSRIAEEIERLVKETKYYG